MINKQALTSNLTKTAIATVGFAFASTALIAAPANADTLTLDLSDATNGDAAADYPTVQIELSQTDPSGPIQATVDVVPAHRSDRRPARRFLKSS